jgi:putative FmdB family regulatory protein
MPIYEYRCSQCGHELEALQKLADAPLTTCPACHAATLVKQMSAAGFQLKGSGWYATDFRGSKTKPAESGDGAKTGATADTSSDSESTTGKKTETKSESKPATESASGNKGETKTAASPTAPVTER